jgi:macrolide transport system ATP-binding/permease protein
LMLLLITGFLVMGISQINNVHTKFDPNTMYLVSIDPVRDGYTPEKAQALFKKLSDRLRNASGVRGVALATQPPFSMQDEDGAIQLTAENSGKSSAVQQPAIAETVGAGYFAALNEPMLAGREFEERDQPTLEPRSQEGSKTLSLPVVLNETAEHKLFGNENAIGKHVRDDKRSYEVVGVVRSLKNGIEINQSVIYLPLTQDDFARPTASGMIIMVRSDAGADALSSIRNEMAFIDPNLNIFDVQTLSAQLDRSHATMRFAVQTYGGIGLFGLVLAAIGLAGITAYGVAQRRKEIAIRTALGASPGQVLRLVLREGAGLVGVGTVLGFLGAMAMAKILSSLTSVFVQALSVGTGDPRLLLGAPLLLAAVAMLACYVPARRSGRIDPLKALRQE